MRVRRRGLAFQDAMLLASLSKRRTAQMQAITATIQKEQNQVIRHADAPTLLVEQIRDALHEHRRLPAAGDAV
ncbi:hypothetical protein, partial [Eggerthella lenta]|uniref:hypothetical protein n=1 Tax=Eggerthella lenta TaxID=84112 RepID=UPI00210D383A